MSLTGTVNDATATNSPCGCSEASGSGTDGGCSSTNSSIHLCIKCDFNCDSLLTLESEDSEWISDSKPYYGCSSENPSTPLSTNGIHCDRPEDNIAVEHLLEIEDMQEFNVDEPLFWPFEGKFNWNHSEESWSPICISPRKRVVVFGSRPMTSRIREGNNKGHETVCSVTYEPYMSSKSSSEIVTSELNDEKVVLKGSEDGNEELFVDKTLLNEDHESNYDLQLTREDFALDQEPEIPIETLVGLKEFDGHEGLDSEFNGDDVFMLEESLLITHASECVVSKQDKKQA